MNSSDLPMPEGKPKKKKRKPHAGCPMAKSCPCMEGKAACPMDGFADCEIKATDNRRILAMRLEDAGIEPTADRIADLKARASALRKTKDGRLVSARSKTGNVACSQAMSQWKKTGMTPQIAATLGKCRAQARLQRAAQGHRDAGREGMAANLERRAGGQYVTQKERLARAQELRAKRAEKRQEPAAQAAPRAQGRGTPERLAQANHIRMMRRTAREENQKRLGATFKEFGPEHKRIIAEAAKRPRKRAKENDRDAVYTMAAVAAQRDNRVQYMVPTNVYRGSFTTEGMHLSKERPTVGTYYAVTPKGARMVVSADTRLSRARELRAQRAARQQPASVPAVQQQAGPASEKPTDYNRLRKVVSRYGAQHSKLQRELNRTNNPAKRDAIKQRIAALESRKGRLQRISAEIGYSTGMMANRRPSLTQQPATPSQPSLREQAAAARAKKGTPLERARWLMQKAEGYAGRVVTNRDIARANRINAISEREQQAANYRALVQQVGVRKAKKLMANRSNP